MTRSEREAQRGVRKWSRDQWENPEVPDITQFSLFQGWGRPSVLHAVVVIFLEFFAWGLLTVPVVNVTAETFPSYTFLMNGMIQGVKVGRIIPDLEPSTHRHYSPNSGAMIGPLSHKVTWCDVRGGRARHHAMKCVRATEPRTPVVSPNLGGVRGSQPVRSWTSN